ncbi:transcriptional regulator [Brenneria goodwinii]|uniref:Transcriptional regulator n=1 Tax=Brenneria goodwinii TaxID=1109412 RepID=A0AAE8JN53_9GAMM|nr:helix-turn-helix domain-containing protein [Brenneria goodwinii]ATA23503.1 regulator [Brenneria goodwinii]RLM25212.1 transcriptional regulator [Brenneria goodwinii]
MRKMEETNPTLISRLSEISDRGISKAEMARIAGVTPQAVNGWFKKGKISKESAISIADAVGVSVSWLLGENVEESTGLSSDEIKMLNLYRQLPEAERERMITLFQTRLKEIDEYVEKYLRGRYKPAE